MADQKKPVKAGMIEAQYMSELKEAEQAYIQAIQAAEDRRFKRLKSLIAKEDHTND